MGESFKARGGQVKRPMPLTIVFGSSTTQDPARLAAAERLGQLLAQAGYAVGTGGYGAIMEAVSRGAAQAGGHVIGYTCDEFPDRAPNPWLHEERRTADLLLRLQRMLTEGDAFLALWGGTGTLTEVLLAWTLGQIAWRYAQPVKPLLLVGDTWAPLLAAIRAHGEPAPVVPHNPLVVATPEAAVMWLQGWQNNEETSCNGNLFQG